MQYKVLETPIKLLEKQLQHSTAASHMHLAAAPGEARGKMFFFFHTEYMCISRPLPGFTHRPILSAFHR